jgi:FHA domain
MTDDELGEALKTLGMDADSYRALPLLPLVQVAWADGSVQEAEQELILRLAHERYGLEDEGLRVLRNWLRHPPELGYVRRGRRILLALCRRSDTQPLVRPPLAVQVTSPLLDVARAAGGFYGQGSISSREANAIDEIASALDIQTARPWVTEDEPTMIPADADEHQDGPPPEIVFPAATEVRSRGSLVHFDEILGEQLARIDERGVVIGRSRENTIQVSFDGQVSRRHCRVFRRDDRFYVEDLGSTTGTWVNGERVIERRLLGGEKLHVGSATFFFQLSPEDQA